MSGFDFSVIAPAGAAFATSLALVCTENVHGRLTFDSGYGIQKCHSGPTPRVGGLALYAGLVIAWLVANGASRALHEVLLLAGLPALVSGLWEDVSKRGSIFMRLAATFISGLVACALAGTWLTRLFVPGLDGLLQFAPVAIVVTALCIAGVANSINIIDGSHGLAGGTVVVSLAALAAIAWQVGDGALAATAIAAACAVVGFLLVNFPWGRLFLGDSGAYLAGFVLAWIAVLLPMRNPQVSPWASLLVCAYPVTETLYSIGRRVAQRRSATLPDHMHLHSLLRLRVSQAFPRWEPRFQNAASSPILWLITAVAGACAFAFRGEQGVLVTLLAVNAVGYHALYVGLLPKEASPA